MNFIVHDFTKEFDAILDKYSKEIISSNWKDKDTVYLFPIEHKQELVDAFYKASYSRHSCSVGELIRVIKGSVTNGNLTVVFRAVNYDWIEAEGGGSKCIECESHLDFVPWTRSMYYDSIFSQNCEYSQATNAYADGTFTRYHVCFVDKV